ncbi:MAG: periplasmic heavy metal sensor [Thermodesulfobacteriota bacterium]
MNKKIKFLLIISIILNFLFGGLLIGDISKSYINKQSMKSHFEEITKNLPPEKQKNILKKIQKLKSDHWKNKDEIFRKRMEIAEVLKAAEFNEALYDKKVTEMHDLYREKAKNLAESIKELATQFSPEERAVLAEMFEKKHKGEWNKDDR